MIALTLIACAFGPPVLAALAVASIAALCGKDAPHA